MPQQSPNLDDKKSGKNQLTTVSPATPLPLLGTNPFPLAITHALSNPFGNTYIANSPLLLFASTNKLNPERSPPMKNEGFEIRRLMSQRGMGRRKEGEERRRERIS